MLFRHIKTGKIYVVMHTDAIDTTNVNDGTHVVVYRQDGTNHPVFVREKSEFHEKFVALPATVMDKPEMAMPCPWCHSKEHLAFDRANDLVRVNCTKCEIMGPTQINDIRAVTSWNHRSQK